MIIGAGISGLSVARVLSRYDNLDILVIERYPDVGWGASKANTSIIHPCHEEEPSKHPVRARLCKEGHDLWVKWVKELDIEHNWPGEIIVALSEEDVKTLYKYQRLATINGIPGVRIIERDELLRLEPNVNPEALAGLWAPTAGTINPMDATIALAENAASNGVRFLFETRVEKIVVRDKKVVGVETSRGFIEADIVINAAGIHADEVSRTAGIDYFTIHPRKGEYILYSDNVDVKPIRIIHTAPTPKTKGVYAITTHEGNLMIGPTAEDLPVTEKDKPDTSRQGFEYVLKQASKLLRRLPPRTKIIKLFAGIRPEPSTRDFIIEFYEEPWGLINVAGIRSPGLTAAPAIGEYVAKLLDDHIGLVEKNKWNPYRKGIPRIRRFSPQEKKKLVRENPSYGRIICYCRQVSEAEILEAIRRMKMIGIDNITFDGVKFRAHAMYGDCQGSFCRLKIAEIISRVTGKPLWQITFKGGNSFYGVGEIDVLWNRYEKADQVGRNE